MQHNGWDFAEYSCLSIVLTVLVHPVFNILLFLAMIIAVKQTKKFIIGANNGKQQLYKSA